jgi:hypothetical protein
VEVLKEFIHISDLHFAEIDETGDPVYDAKLPETWSQAPWLKGMVGHNPRAIKELAAFFRKRCSPDRPKPVLVVTGDLTCIGRDGEFEAARSYLGAGIPQDDDTIGLGVRDWRRYGILGNHDFWPGAVDPFLTRNKIAAELCHDLPSVTTKISLGAGFSIRLVRINSDDDVWTTGQLVTPLQYYNRVAATGCFANQLLDAGQKLTRLDDQSPDPGEIRVLLLHHSRAIGSGITERSSRDLDDFIASRSSADVCGGFLTREASSSYGITLGRRTVSIGLSPIAFVALIQIPTKQRFGAAIWPSGDLTQRSTPTGLTPWPGCTLIN